MPILFDFYASPSDPEKEEKEKYHARVVRSHTVDINDIVPVGGIKLVHI